MNSYLQNILVVVVVGFSVIALGGVIHVDDDAIGANDGTNWTDAYTFLQDALMMASEGDEIHVAQGVYRPDQFVLRDPSKPRREETFQLKTGVGVLGGYAGLGGPAPDTRDIARYETILSGDIGDEDTTCHVVTGSGTDATAVLDGFTITGGRTCPSCACFLGGGMYNDAGSPTVRNCTFVDNFALNYGGGMCNDTGSSPLVVNCRFIGNSATDGGAVDNEYGSPTFMNCVFAGNWVDEYNADSFSGGAMYNFHSSPTLIHCTVYGNEVRQWWDYCGGIYNRGDDSRPILANCILWGNIDEYDDIQRAQIAGGQPIVNYCCIQGLRDDFPGAGNIDANPWFANPDGHDYHLRSQAGRWDAAISQWVQDEVTSPCIDAGDPSTPIMHEPFPNGGIANMGAYGGTAEASKSWFGVPVCEIIVTGDINGDCSVNLADFALMAGHWLEEQGG